MGRAVAVVTTALLSATPAAPVAGIVGAFAGGLTTVAIANLKGKKKDKPSARPVQPVDNRPEIIRQVIPFRRHVYGRPKVGSHYCDVRISTVGSNPGNVANRQQAGAYKVIQLVVAGHRTAGFDELRLDGVRLLPDAQGYATNPEFVLNGQPFVRTSVRLGDAFQAADPVYLENFPDTAPTYRQIGYTVVTCELYYGANEEEHRLIWGDRDENTFNGLLRGYRVFDPRRVTQHPDRPETHEWDDNAALCCAHLLTNPRVTRGVTWNDIDIPALVEAANVCSQGMPRLESEGGGFEKQYTVNAVFSSEERPYDILTNMLNAMRGRLVLSQGKYRIIAGAPRQPVKAIGKRDLTGTFSTVNDLPIADRVSRISARGVVPQADYELQNVPLLSVDTEPGQPVNEVTLSLPYVQGASRIQRIALAELKAEQFNEMQSLSLPPSHGLVLETGDVVSSAIDLPGMRESNGPYEVIGIRNVGVNQFQTELRRWSNTQFRFGLDEIRDFDTRTIQ